MYESFGLALSFYIVVYMMVINGLGILYMRSDKHRAKHKKYRISERTLFTIALLGGSIGIFVGLRLFRHKTRQPSFKYGIPIIFIITYGMLFALTNMI